MGTDFAFNMRASFHGVGGVECGVSIRATLIRWIRRRMSRQGIAPDGAEGWPAQNEEGRQGDQGSAWDTGAVARAEQLFEYDLKARQESRSENRCEEPIAVM